MRFLIQENECANDVINGGGGAEVRTKSVIKR